MRLGPDWLNTEVPMEMFLIFNSNSLTKQSHKTSLLNRSGLRILAAPWEEVFSERISRQMSKFDHMTAGMTFSACTRFARCRGCRFLSEKSSSGLGDIVTLLMGIS